MGRKESNQTKQTNKTKLTEHHLEFLNLKAGCTGWSESTFVKMPHCWKSHVVAYTVLEYGKS